MTVQTKELLEFLQLMEKLSDENRREMLRFLEAIRKEAVNPATGLTPAEVIRISRKQPIDTFYPAEEIAMEFRARVCIPDKPEMFMDFLQMVAAVYWGGVIAGIRKERRKRRSC